MWDWIIDTAFNNPITDFVNYITSADGIADIVSFPYRAFNTLTDVFFTFLDYSKVMFSGFGARAVQTFDFDFREHFFTTIVGLIFGFFIFKFILNKVFDLITNLLDPM